MSSGIKYRELDWNNKKEVGFVYKSWLGSYKNHADIIPYNIYVKLYRGLLDRLLRRSGATVVLAYNVEHPDQIYAFAAVERNKPVLHYIYTKEDYRRKFRIASDLLSYLLKDEPEFSFTFNTAAGRKFLKERGGVYRPKLIRGPLED